MAQPYLSLARAKSLVVEIVETSPPGTRNPTHPQTNGCIYYSEHSGKRCIAGEVLHRMGMPAPASDAGYMHGMFGAGVSYVRKGYLSAETAHWLGLVQKIFDGGAMMGRVPPTWRTALKECRHLGFL